MKIPRTLKIGGHQYRIRFPYNFHERNDCYGQHWWDGKEIRIAGQDENGNSRAQSSVIVSFIHELLHAFEHLQGGEGSKEEYIVSMAEIIYQFLIDNKLI